MDLLTLPLDDLHALQVAVTDELTRRRVIADAEGQEARDNAAYEDAVSVEPPLDWGAITDGQTVGPGRRVIAEDGHTYRNDSGTWLNPTVTPEAHPLWWVREDLPDVETVRVWKLGDTYTVGELVRHGLIVARVVLAHRADDAAWTPGSAPALWKVQTILDEDPEEPEPEPEDSEEPETPSFPAWDPTATYSSPPGATVTHKGVIYDLTFAVATPGQEPGDPTMWAIWKARTP